MIDFILKNNASNKEAKVAELFSDLNRLFQIEKTSVQDFNEHNWVSEKLLNQLKEDKRKEINDLYGTIYSNDDLKNNNVVTKFLLNKTGGRGRKPKFADFFSGAGGLGLGLENSGFQPSFITDYNYSALQSYYLNRKLPLNRYYLGDMKNIIEDMGQFKKNLSDVFLISGGPPCQGFSMANRQPLLNDPRNELYKDFLLILKEIRPPFFLLENVRGMAKKKAEIEEDMKNILGKDYDYCFLILNAKDYNIPQNRERFFIIGNRINVNPNDLAYNIKSKGNGTKYFLKHALEGLPSIQAGTKFNQPLLENENVGFKIKKIDIAETSYSSYINRGRKQEYVFNHKSRYNNENDREIFARLPQGGNSLHESIQDIMKYKTRNEIFTDKYYRLIPNKVSKAITSHMRFDCHMYIHPWQARGLSPREAARIQTFPDDYIFMGRPNEWYQQIGNAVPVKLAEVIGKEIIKYYK
ncbi:DNA cytosine methyltransferase [Aquimarina sp. 2201CG1-2-11]|uniref:DNA cytosine methyltransferase n=1 Tax=Aquimarina discodermiae TaxID=3231043 RepID=UPI0034634EF7